jgi:putative transposase
MDDRHKMFAARYIENNPVAAAIVERAEDWPWSSARAHLEKRDDGLTDWHELGQHVDNWKAMLIDGLDAGAVIESAIRTGRPLGQIAGQCESVSL